MTPYVLIALADVLGIGAIAWLLVRSNAWPAVDGPMRTYRIVICALVSFVALVMAGSIVGEDTTRFILRYSQRYHGRDEWGYWFTVAAFWVPGVMFGGASVFNLLRRGPPTSPRWSDHR